MNVKFTEECLAKHFVLPIVFFHITFKHCLSSSSSQQFTRKGWCKHSSAETLFLGSNANIGRRKSENSYKCSWNYKNMQIPGLVSDLGSLRIPFIFLRQHLVERPGLQLGDMSQLACNTPVSSEYNKLIMEPCNKL